MYTPCRVGGDEERNEERKKKWNRKKKRCFLDVDDICVSPH